jgi:hypothetical protein
MPAAGKIIIPICVAWILAVIAFDWWQTNVIKLAIMPVSAAYLISCLASFFGVFCWWRQWRFRSLVPMGICFATMILARTFSPSLMDAGFARVLPRYTAVVQEIESGQIVVSNAPTRVTLPASDATLAYTVWADRSTNGDLTVTFFVGGSFPVKHWGYLYRSSGQNPPPDWWIKNDWMGRRLADKWFYIFD